MASVISSLRLKTQTTTRIEQTWMMMRMSMKTMRATLLHVDMAEGQSESPSVTQNEQCWSQLCVLSLRSVLCDLRDLTIFAAVLCSVADCGLCPLDFTQACQALQIKLVISRSSIAQLQSLLRVQPRAWKLISTM